MPHLHTIHFNAFAPGPRLIVTGAVHGNETCGTTAILRVAEQLQLGSLSLTAGALTLVPVTNALAYQRAQRDGERNLNRRLLPSAEPRQYEDHVANALCPLLVQHDVLLDLHSFRAGDLPFALVGPQDNDGTLEPFGKAAIEEALAVRLGVRRIVHGWLPTYAVGVERRRARSTLAADASLTCHVDYGVGTTDYMRRVGGCAMTLECGQHDDPNAPEVAWRAIVNTLAHLRMIAADDPSAVESVESLQLFEVIDRHHEGDRFDRPWINFDSVAHGERIGTRHDGTPVLAAVSGRIVFPNATAEPDKEWFYLARQSDRFDRLVMR